MAWWIPVAMAAGSMLQQGEQQRQQRKNEQAAMEANAAAMEYSPWTGMQTKMMGPSATGGMGSVLGAGAQGAMMGAMFNQQNPGAKPTAKPTAAPTQQAHSPWASIQSRPMSNSPWSGMDQQYMKKPSLYGGGGGTMYG